MPHGEGRPGTVCGVPSSATAFRQAGGSAQQATAAAEPSVGTMALELVREMWANLLNEAPSMAGPELAIEIARIEKIQSHFEGQMSSELLKVRCTRQPSIRGRVAAARRAHAIT